MKILIGSDVAPPYIGGGEEYVINLGKTLTKMGHEVHWITAKFPGTNDKENYEGITIHRVAVPFKKHFHFPGRQFFFATSIIPGIKLAKEMDIVQMNTLVAAPFGWLIPKFARKPSVMFVHELFGKKLWSQVGQNVFEKLVYPYMEKRMAKAPYDHYLCPSKYSKQTLVRYGASSKKITIIPHGLNFKLFNPKKDKVNYRKKFGLESYKLFGYAGRLRARKTAQSKNLLGLLKAVPFVLEKVPNAKLVLDGLGYEELEPFVRKMGLEDYVVWLGEKYGKDFSFNSHFYKMCDLIVCPAISEGFDFMLANASACGTPIVATNCGAHPDRVINGKNGLLTGVKPEQIAAGITKILSNNKLAEKFGKEGATYAKKFTWKKSAEAHLKVYEEVIRKHKYRQH
jgi:glycosyltransferase involved in cell wall biosynthesis